MFSLKPSYYLTRRNFYLFAIKNNISVYNEETGKGFLRALMIRTNSTATKAMAVIIINCKIYYIPNIVNISSIP